ncbi:MAG: SHOCT domain-containing protein [Gammaproteobacteria bacterium]|nr:MAG: SHOCT domain-containing protein [Gammaproteobacteria bacterium]
MRTPAPTASAAPPIATAVQTAPVYNSSLPTAESHNDKRVDERLTTLKSLHDRGLITKDEFDAKRREILDQL